MHRMRFPIKAKLTIATLVPLTVAILICWMAGVLILHKKISHQAQEKVRHDLNTAHEAYTNELSRIATVVRLSANLPRIRDALATDNAKEVSVILSPLRTGEKLDLLVAVDAGGKVVYRANNPAMRGDNRRWNALVAQALRGKIASGTVIYTDDELHAEGEALARQAVIQVVATPRALPPLATVERRGMILMVAAPVRDRRGEVLGALYGGVLLNNNNSLVDAIKGIVYDRGDGGSATIFLNDLRIATNVKRSDGQRAIGTSLSREVYDRVIVQGKKWVGRAFVVTDWCFSAYEPILSPEGAPIGSLYVGMQEAPYLALKRQMALLLTGVLLLSALIGIATSGFLGRRLAQPIKELESLARRLAAGERSVRSTVNTRDEIGDLAVMFNEMSSSLAEREAHINELNSTLEQKVRERTAEVEEKNLLLAKTREELHKSEKLAAIGELAAGVGHEINNPLAIIRGNTELLQMAIPEEDPNREEVDTIFQQVKRVERIIASLLTFARKQPKELESFSVNGLLHEIVEHVSYQVSLEGITVQEQYAEDLGEVQGDGGQLRQVFTNLIVNAVQAMPDGGLLTIGTTLYDEAGIYCVQISDSGLGISQHHVSQLFDPFFTTKSTGTGLGLSVSYGIVKEHGGQIDVRSAPGEGSTFKVLLPV